MKRFLQNLSLGSQIALFTTAIVAVSLLAITLITIQLEREYYFQEMETQAETLLNTLPYSFRDELYFVSVDELQDISLQIGKSEKVNRFVIYDKTGIILADSDSPKYTPTQDIDPIGKELVTLPQTESYFDWTFSSTFTAGRAIYLNDRAIGALLLDMSTTDLEKKINALIIQSVSLFFLIVGFGALLSFTFSMQISNPLKKLMLASESMARNSANFDSDLRVNVEGTEEIGKLGLAFNNMMEAIQTRERALLDMTVSLEQKVDERTEELRQRNEELLVMATSDALTKLKNRRHFFDLAEKECERAKRYDHPVALIIADVDHFKEINDTYGHLVGDDILKNLANFLQTNIRNVDILARYGGEEFIILMPEINCEFATTTAERLRKEISEITIVKTPQPIRLTVSFGIACWCPENKVDIDTLIHRADSALYQAKRSGRNRVTLWEPPADS